MLLLETMPLAVRRRNAVRAAVIVALLAGGNAHAQQAASAPATDNSDEKLEEIVVTAQKREQSLQDVPIAITAITGDELTTNRVENVADLSGLAPNMTVRPSAGSVSIPSFSMRGITSYGVVAGTDKETSIYLDGVYIGSPRASIFDLPDAQRIEVLRGPQGTLFGRNSTAGAVSVVTRAPKGEFGIQEDVTVGNFGEIRSRTSIDLPTYGPFSAYLTFVHEERRGDIRNTGAGTFYDRSGPDTHQAEAYSPGYLGSHRINSVFTTIKFAPTENFSTTYKLDYSEDHYTPDGEALIAYNPAAPLIGGLIGALITSQATPVQIDTGATRPASVNNSFTLPAYQRVTGHNLTSELFINDNSSVKNILAYRDSYIDSDNQLDGAGGLVFTPQALLPYAEFAVFSTHPALATAPPATQAAAIGGAATALAPLLGGRFNIVANSNQTWSKQWSDELQYNFSSKYLTLTSGGIYYWQEDYVGGPPGITGTSEFSITPPNGRIALGPVDESYNLEKSWAGYTQAEVHLLPVLDAVGGLRVTRDEKSGTYYTGGVFTPGSAGYANGTFAGVDVFPFTYEKTQWTYSGGLNYTPVQGDLVYAKWSTGYVSGGSVGGVAFRPENVVSYETGAKADWLESKLRTNLALFYARYQNVQQAEGGTNVGHPELGTVVVDGGNVYARGAELEISVLPFRGLTAGASFGYTHDSFSGISPVLYGASLEAPGGPYEATLIPKFTSTVYSEYETLPLFDGGKLMFRIDANWRDAVKYLNNPNEVAEVPAYAPIAEGPEQWIVNARVALRELKFGPTKGEVAFWVRNLTNNGDLEFPIAFANFLASSDFQPARTFGLDLSIKY
jgi:iron complex outermembrane recepter protein